MTPGSLSTSDSSSQLWWSVPATGMLLLAGLLMVFGSEEGKKGHQTSYDASKRGFRAAYLLLDELSYPVQRSKRLGGDSVRWVLFPRLAIDEAAQLAAWVQRGGLLLLADDTKEFADKLGLPLTIGTLLDDEAADEQANGLDVQRLAGGDTFVKGPMYQGEVLVTAGGKPMVTVYQRGLGQIWLVNRPELFCNEWLGHADNALLVCRLANAMLEDQPGNIAFDEYFHGMHERPSVTELLFQPPTLWLTLQALVLLGVLLWHHAPRFGTTRAVPLPSRRSHAEFLDALSSLLERKGDHASAFRVAREAFARELERELGLPVGAPVTQIVLEAYRRRPVRRRRLVRLLTGESVPPGCHYQRFLKALIELETARDEFFLGRHDR